jgi:hypothetical protein
LEWLEDRLVPSIPDGTILAATAPSPFASADQFSFPTGIIGVDPSTGAQFPVSVGGPFSLPTYIAQAPNQQLYVADLTAFGSGAIIRVDANTGQQSIVTRRGFINGPNALVFMNGFLYVANEGDGSGTIHTLVRVDPSTGAQTVITRSGGFVLPTGMKPAPGNSVYISDEVENVQGSNPGKLWEVNLDNGQQKLIKQGEPFNHPVDIAVGVNGNIIVANTGSPENNIGGSLFGINPQTRARRPITSFGPHSGTNSVVVDKNGGIFVGAIAAGSAPGQIIAVDRVTGTQRTLCSAQNLSLVEGLAVFSGSGPSATPLVNQAQSIPAEVVPSGAFVLSAGIDTPPQTMPTMLRSSALALPVADDAANPSSRPAITGQGTEQTMAIDCIFSGYDGIEVIRRMA